MVANRDDIFRGALLLDQQGRAELIGALIESPDSEVEEGVEEAWRIEIERRARNLESGAVQSIPWEVVRERLGRAASG